MKVREKVVSFYTVYVNVQLYILCDINAKIQSEKKRCLTNTAPKMAIFLIYFSHIYLYLFIYFHQNVI